MDGPMAKSRFICVSCLIISILFLAFAPFVFSDDVYYFYDDAGQLTRAIKAAESVSFQYDVNGNLVSLSDGPVTTAVPSIQGITPNVLFIGTAMNVVITGGSLFSTKGITSDNPYLNIKTISTTDTQINATITVSSLASAGTANLTVTTLYGAASTNVTLSSSHLELRPDMVVLSPGSLGTVTANIVPPINQSLTIWLNNNPPAVVAAPGSVVIPVSGTASFNVNALSSGSAVVSSCGAKTLIYVAQPFATLPGEYAISNSKPVSVSVDSPTAVAASIESVPISFFVDSPAGKSEVTSIPISVSIDSLAGNSTVVSELVSVGISQ